jgi:hypothetical protein
VPGTLEEAIAQEMVGEDEFEYTRRARLKSDRSTAN